MNDKIVYINSQIACALIEMEAMKAENQQRLIEGKSLAYTEKEFSNISIKYGIHHNDILGYLYE